MEYSLYSAGVMCTRLARSKSGSNLVKGGTAIARLGSHAISYRGQFNKTKTENNNMECEDRNDNLNIYKTLNLKNFQDNNVGYL